MQFCTETSQIMHVLKLNELTILTIIQPHFVLNDVP